mmetsp:Transcript_21213/g.49813  ORF Transcript_21213/g.49813 Transcript_21213/m.49813 type:complete len:491 (-) Transcript_21213:33-1505(-)
MNQARMICAGPRASRAMAGGSRGRLQFTRQIHHSLMALNLDDKDVSSSSSSDKDSSATVASSQTGQGYAPVQTLNKSPIVQKLWKTRDEAKRRIMGDMTLGESEYGDLSLATADVISGRNSCSYEPPSKIGKHPSESEVGIEYPFSTDEFLKETYKNPWGEMRFGKILEDLDALAGNIAFEHVEGNPLIVTAGVDRIRLRERPNIGADQQLSGRVTWVGSSSMEIRMRIAAVGSDAEWLEAYFTFVTLHPETKQAIRISPLLPETDEERGAFELGALKAQAKKAARKNKIQIGRPLSEESLKIDTRAARLLEEAGTLLRMPSLADQDTMLISQTAQSNAMVAQPQARNLHDRIFGGFLMRRSFELAFATAYLFGGDKPRFLEVDDISFDKPVDVGDLLVFKSHVLYTRPDGGHLGSYVDNHEGLPLVFIEVECWVNCPESKKAEVSNHFYYTFALPNKTSCRRVLPANIDQARRQATRMHIGETQAELRP